MGITHAPLTLQFANQTVTITMPPQSSDCLPKQLRRHFVGCLADDGEGILSTELAETAVFRLKSPHVKQWQLWQGKTLLLEAEAVTYLFEPLMQAVLEHLITPAADHLILHAAGVAWAGWGVVVCGTSGSGKSTLTAQLLQEGFLYLSDEALTLDLSLNRMQGFARSLVLKSGSEFVWRGQQASQEVLTLPQHITWVTPAYLGGDICRHASPQLLLFPQFEQGSDLTVVSLSAGEAAFALFQNLANARNLPEQGFRSTAELARRLPAYRVIYGDEAASSSSVQAVSHWIQSQLPAR